jgi:hypothetical protein
MASVLKQDSDVSISDSFYSAILQNKSIIDSDCNDMGALVDVSIPPLKPSAYTVPKSDKIAARSFANFSYLESAALSHPPPLSNSHGLGNFWVVWGISLARKAWTLQAPTRI